MSGHYHEVRCPVCGCGWICKENHPNFETKRLCEECFKEIFLGEAA